MCKCKKCDTVLGGGGGLDCPAYCDTCEESRCPKCGGEMGKSIDNAEMDSYTSGGCHSCDYECCGNCL